MKTEPTDIDREAARLFVPAPGMRWLERERGTWWTVTPRDFFGDGFKYRLVALDTDDPATVGVMLAQVEDAAGADDVSVEKLRPYCRGFAVFIRGSYKHKPQRTRGAALVAAMKAIKGDPTR